MRRVRWLLPGLTLLLLLTAAGGCDSGGSTTAVGPGSFDADAAAQRLAALGTLRISGAGGGAGTSSRVVSGAIGASQAAIQFPFVGAAQVAQVSALRSGGDLWFRRSAATGSVDIGPALFVFTARGKPPWVRSTTANVAANSLLLPYEPVELLRALAAHRIPFRKVTTSGGPAFRATVPTSEKVPGPQGPSVRPLAGTMGVERVTVWTDRHGTPVRLAVVTPGGTISSYTVAAGGKAVVRAPAAADIESPSEAQRVARGPYETVYTATAGSTPFQILRAPGTDGGTCWKVESDPTYRPLYTQGADGGVCVPPTATTGDDLDQIGFPIDALAATGYELFALIVPPGSTADMILADGATRRPVVVDAHSGLAIFAGPLSEIAGLMELKLPDGTRVDCGPGPVSSPADLPPENQSFGAVGRAQLRDLPWNCVDASLVE